MVGMSRGQRLVTPLRRRPGAPGGFVPIPYPNAVAVAERRFAEIQVRRGPAAIGVVGGAVVEEVESEVVWLVGCNPAECSPATASGVAAARARGARVIVQDSRAGADGGAGDLHLPVRAGRDGAIVAAVLQLLIDSGWMPAGEAEALEEVALHSLTWPAARAAEETGVPEPAIRQVAELWAGVRSATLVLGANACHRTIRGAAALVRAIEAGEIAGLVSICFDPPDDQRLAGALDQLEFFVAVDSVLSDVARHAHLVLPLPVPVAVYVDVAGSREAVAPDEPLG